MEDFDIPIQSWKSSKGKLAVGCNGYIYRQHPKDRPKEGATKRRLMCNSTNRCNGKLWTNIELTAGMERGGHLAICNPDPERVRLAKLQSEMGTAAETAVQPMPQLFRVFKEQLIGDELACARFKDFKSHDSVLYRKHNKLYQNNPRSLAELEIPEEKQFTIGTNHNFLFHRSPDNGTLIFSTDENIRKLATLPNWAMDGMFGFIPRIFSNENGQLWSIHAFWGNKLIPLVYVLTTSKSQQKYTEVIRLLKDRAAELGLVLNPTSVACDFESGLLPALAAEFPGCRVHGCHYHFCQCIYRKVQSLGLVEWYAEPEDTSCRANVRMLMASSFLPPIRVHGWYEHFVDTMPLNVRQRLQPLLNYFYNQWLSGNVGIEIWNMHQVQRRTNNNLEGWHNGFEKRLGKHPNPGFLKFIDALRSEQCNTETNIHQLTAGQNLVRENKIYKEVNARINTLTNIYIGARDNITFDPETALVRGISYNLSRPANLSL